MLIILCASSVLHSWKIALFSIALHFHLVTSTHSHSHSLMYFCLCREGNPGIDEETDRRRTQLRRGGGGGELQHGGPSSQAGPVCCGREWAAHCLPSTHHTQQDPFQEYAICVFSCINIVSRVLPRFKGHMLELT